jgi:RNA polymerase sigma-70 factor (ECF subfamily)
MRMTTSEDQLKALMEMGLGGDAGAHSTLLRALVPLLRSFYRRRMRGAEEDVEDLVQETLIAIHARRASYDRDRAFTAWFYAIARHQMIDYFRRRKVHVPLEDVEAILATEGFEDAISARMDVDRLLDTLSPKQARAIRDTHVDGKSIAEAAEAAGIGESDVKVSVHRGLKSLAGRIRGSRA